MGRGRSFWRITKLLALRKLFAVVLAFSCILSPLGTAFAQVVGSDTPPIDPGTSTAPASTMSDTTPQPPPEAFSIPGVDIGAPTSPTDGTTANPDTASGAASTPSDTTASTDSSNAATSPDAATQPQTLLGPSGNDTPPTTQSPTVFTLQNERPKADGNTGALIQNLKLDIPPGRNGLQPDLALQYNSQRTEDSIVGYGWTITIPYIQRLNKTGLAKSVQRPELHIIH